MYNHIDRVRWIQKNDTANQKSVRTEPDEMKSQEIINQEINSNIPFSIQKLRFILPHSSRFAARGSEEMINSTGVWSRTGCYLCQSCQSMTNINTDKRKDDDKKCFSDHALTTSLIDMTLPIIYPLRLLLATSNLSHVAVTLPLSGDVNIEGHRKKYEKRLDSEYVNRPVLPVQKVICLT